MLFNSSTFVFLFLPITLIVFFQISIRGYYRIAIAWLVIASFLFYGWWEVSSLGLLLGSIIFNYFIGVALSRRYTTKLINQKRLLALGVIVNLGLLGYFKYANFFVSSITNLVGFQFYLKPIILPLAISFFTFNQIAYLVDAYRGEPQFERKAIYRFNSEDIAVGLTIFALGLFKKVVFADQIALWYQQTSGEPRTIPYATLVFYAASQGVSLTFFEAWSGALAYSLQLYFDFSGYSDMAIGAARMFGIKFPLNFSSPYKAVNIIDFWRRWHITLSYFLRDYIYIPLGGNRKGELRRYLNLMITMLLGGLWHGAGWTFVLWGGLHGLYLVINHQWHTFRQALGHDLNKSNWWSQGVGCLVTFLAVAAAWVLFRAENLNAAITMLKAMIGFNGMSLSSSLPSGKNLTLLLLFIAWFTPNTQQWMGQYEPALKQHVVKAAPAWCVRLWKRMQWQPTIAFGTITGVLMFICTKILLASPESEFFYFNF